MRHPVFEERDLMCCHPPKSAVVLLCVAAILAGCAPQQPLYLRNNGDLSHYIGMSQTIDNADVPEPPFSEIEGTVRPFSLDKPAPKEHWDLTLEDAIRYALHNGKVLRQIGGQEVGGRAFAEQIAPAPPSFLTGSPLQAGTIYDPAIAETDARSGVNAALSLFDPQLSTDLFWERNHEPRDVNPNFSTSVPTQLNQDVAEFDTTLSKTTADGTVLSLGMSTNYDLERNNNSVNPDLLHNYTTSIQMEIRRPLLQGYGVEYNRIAGPGAIPGFNQGVLIARINTDITLAAFEASVRNLVSDVENQYWDLHFAYHNLDAWVKARDRVLRTWHKVKALVDAGVLPVSDEAQAREEYFSFRNLAEQAQWRLYHAESNLRYMMGLAATDGRLIRPADDPTTAKITFDWSQVQTEAMSRSPELREARWRVKQRELELIAAKNYLLPRVDLDARYRWLGMGDKIIDHGNNVFSDNGANVPAGALENLGSGEFQDWHIGIEAQIPLGYRKQKDGVKNAELALARDRAKLREIELEVSHQVAFAISDMEANLVMSATNFNHELAAQRFVDATETVFDTDPNGAATLLNLLGAYRSLAQAEVDYFGSITNYARSIAGVHYRKGSLLEYNGVYLTEGPWPAKAYFDARRRARTRSAALYMDYGFTYPKVLTRGPNPQFPGEAMGAGGMPTDGPAMGPGTPAKQPSDTTPEIVPAPPAEPSGTAPRVLPPPPQPPAAPPGSVNPDSTAAASQPGDETRDLTRGLSALASKADEATDAPNPPVRQTGYQGR